MPPQLQQSVDLPTLVACLALLAAILSAFPALLVRRNRWRVASRFRWLAFLLLACAGACFPAPLFAFALIFLLAARGAVAIMARIITAVVFLLILAAGEVGLLWAMRSFAPDRFLAVCFLAVAVGFAGWVRTTDLSEWGYAPDPS